MHVGHVGGRGVFETDGETRRVRAETDATSGGGEAEVPNFGGEGGLDAAGEADEFVLVFGEPGETVDGEAGV